MESGGIHLRYSTKFDTQIKNSNSAQSNRMETVLSDIHSYSSAENGNKWILQYWVGSVVVVHYFIYDLSTNERVCVCKISIVMTSRYILHCNSFYMNEDVRILRSMLCALQWIFKYVYLCHTNTTRICRLHWPHTHPWIHWIHWRLAEQQTFVVQTVNISR